MLYTNNHLHQMKKNYWKYYGLAIVLYIALGGVLNLFENVDLHRLSDRIIGYWLGFIFVILSPLLLQAAFWMTKRGVNSKNYNSHFVLEPELQNEPDDFLENFINRLFSKQK